MVVKVTKKVKYAMALYHKMSQGVYFTWKVYAFFKKCTTFGLCHPSNHCILESNGIIITRVRIVIKYLESRYRSITEILKYDPALLEAHFFCGDLPTDT